MVFFWHICLVAKIDGIVLVWLNLTAQEEFEDLCFRFGIELDDVVSISLSLRSFFSFFLSVIGIDNFERGDVLMNSFFAWMFQTTEKAIIRKEKHLDEEEVGDDEEVIYKIEVPANRYFTI